MENKTTSPVKDRLQKHWTAIGKGLTTLLNVQFNRLTLRSKKTIIVCFAILVTTLSGTIIIRPFLEGKQTLSFALPMQIAQPPTANFPQEIFSEEDYLLLMQFKHTLDSLKKYDPQVYQDIIRDRQGLVDSLEYLVSIYNKMN